MLQRQIPCMMGPDLILVPNMLGQVHATIDVQQTGIGGIAGSLSFGGGVRAFLTFDDTGRHVLSYTLTVGDNATQRSVENIIAAL